MINKVIKKIEIDSFRSFKNMTLDVAQTNVFSGLNDVGKSNLLKALNLFFNNQTDFNLPYKFERDYSKISLAAAQRSSKKKQQVKIKVHFVPPESYKSLKGKEVWVERAFDRYGNVSEIVSIENSSRIKSSIKRFVTSVQYFYIPALKGSDVLQFILGEVGKMKIINDEQITQLNNGVNENMSDLAGILSGSSITTQTKFELPVLVEDFWQKLNINTTYDEFNELDGEIKASKKGKKDKLKSEYYQIPLQQRGEGIKSKYIPPLLQWIQNNEKRKQYVWGIDEPENSLEFKKSQEVAALYFNEYSKNTQLFLTSHSWAFIFPETEQVSVFRCFKDTLGETLIEPTNTLLGNIVKSDLANEIGALVIQKIVVEEWRKKDKIQTQQLEILTKEVSSLKDLIQESNKACVITEGKTDQILIQAAIKKLKLKNPDVVFHDIPDDFGSSKLLDLLKSISTGPTLNRKIIGIFDRDEEKHINEIGDLKSFGNNVYGFCIPQPPTRKLHKNISIEFYFTDSELKREHEGRCLYFDNEVEWTQSAQNKQERFLKKRGQPDFKGNDVKKILCEDIGKLDWIHSKTVFANLVANNTTFSRDFNFENFQLIIKKISEVLEL